MGNEYDDISGYFDKRIILEIPEIPEVNENKCPWCGGIDSIVDNRCEMPGCYKPVIYKVKEYKPRKLTVEEAFKIAQIKNMQNIEYGTKKEPTKDDLWAEIARLKQQINKIQNGNPLELHESYQNLFGHEKLQELGFAPTKPIPKKEYNVLRDQGDPFEEF